MSDVPTAPLPDDAHEPAGQSEQSEQSEQIEQIEQVQVEQVPAEEAAATVLDLDEVERDLADVELALARLDAGTYWTDEITGSVIPDEVLAEQPTARRAGGR